MPDFAHGHQFREQLACGLEHEAVSLYLPYCARRHTEALGYPAHLGDPCVLGGDDVVPDGAPARRVAMMLSVVCGPLP